MAPGQFPKHLPNKVADTPRPMAPGLFPKHCPTKLLMHDNLCHLAGFLNIWPTKMLLMHGATCGTPGLFTKHLPNKKLMMHGNS
jgi:hypothetical protein